MVTKRLGSCVVAVLVMLASGLLGSFAAVIVSGLVNHDDISGEEGLWCICIGLAVFLMFSPSLLLPYLAVFGRRQTKSRASLHRAAVCGFFYSPILLITISRLQLQNSGYQFLQGWAIGAAWALIPGVILTLLALLGTYLIRAASSE